MGIDREDLNYTEGSENVVSCTSVPVVFACGKIEAVAGVVHDGLKPAEALDLFETESKAE